MARSGIPEPVGVFEAEPESVQATAEDLPAPESLVPVVASAPSDVLSGWYVQLGSFGSLDNAQRFAQRLEEAGFTAHIGEYRREGQALMRVLVGPQASADEARALAGVVRQAVGHDGHVVRLNTTQ
jgi:cell division septation protein DedD